MDNLEMEMEYTPNEGQLGQQGDLRNAGDDVTGLEPHILKIVEDVANTAMLGDMDEEHQDDGDAKEGCGTGDHNALGHLCHICVNIPYEAVNLLEQTTGLDAREARKAAFTFVRYMKENRHTEEVQHLLRYISDLAFEGSTAHKEVDEYYKKMITESAKKNPVRSSESLIRMHEMNETFLTARGEGDEEEGEDEQDGIYPSITSFELEEATILASHEAAGGAGNVDFKFDERNKHVPELLRRNSVIKEESGNAENYAYDGNANIQDDDEDGYAEQSNLADQDCPSFRSVTKVNRLDRERHTLSSVTMTLDVPLKFPKYVQTEPVTIKHANRKQEMQFERDEEKRIRKSSMSGILRTPQTQSQEYDLRSPINGLRRVKIGTCSEGRTFGNKKHYDNKQSFGDHGHGQNYDPNYISIPREAVSLMKRNSGVDGRSARKAAYALIQYMREQRHTDGVQNLLKFISGKNNPDTFCVRKLVDSYDVSSQTNRIR